MARRNRSLALFRFLSDHIDGKRRYSDDDIAAMIAAVGGLPHGRVTSFRAKADGSGLEETEVERRDELIHRVELAGVQFAHATVRQFRPPPSKILKELNSIGIAGRRMLQVLSQCATDGTGRLRETDACRALKAQFAHWAEVNQGYPFVFPDITPRQFQTRDDPPVRSTHYNPDLALQRCVAAISMLTELADSATARQRSRVAKRNDRKRNQGDVALRQFIGDLMGIYLDVFERRPAVSNPSRRSDAGGPFIRFVQAALKPHGIKMTGHAVAQYVPRLSRIVKSAQRKS